MKKFLSPVIIFLLLAGGFFMGWRSVSSQIYSLGSHAVPGSVLWRQWDLDAGASPNPYALARFLLAGQVPPARSLFLIYTRDVDDGGERLQGHCRYRIEASRFDARWWAFSTEPKGVHNFSANAVVSSENRQSEALGALNVQLSFYPVPGNWLKPSTQSNFTLKLVVTNDSRLEFEKAVTLPQVVKLECS